MTDGQPLTSETVALEAFLDWLRPLLATAGPDDYLILLAPPGLDQDKALKLARLLTLQVAVGGATFQLVDASRRVQVLRLPEHLPVRAQTTDLRDAGRT